MAKRNKAKIQIKNDVSVDKNAKSNVVPSDAYQKKNVVFDFSFKGVYQSVKHGDFDNYLKNETDFVEQFRLLMKNVTHLSSCSMARLINSGEFRHCHSLKDEEDIIARKIIMKLFEKNEMVSYEQEVGDETLYQLGCQDGTRFIGAIRENVFRVYFLDYFHSLNYDEKKNRRGAKGYRFCPMTGTLKET